MPADSVKNLRVVFDNDFSFSKHVSNVCRACYYYMKDLRRVRRYLTVSVATSLANALVSSRLDYCNSLLHNITDQNMRKLQVVQNSLCRIVKRVSRFDHITEHRKALHWLPIEYRIKFKINLLTFKALSFGQPMYLRQKLCYHPSARKTRHLVPESEQLLIPRMPSQGRSTFFKRCFRVSAPTLWNELPTDVRLATSVTVFRRRLKAFLFSVAYPSIPPP